MADIKKIKKIAGRKLFFHLTGKGFDSSPAYKGGLFEQKSRANGKSYNSKHIQSVIRRLSHLDINTPMALSLLILDHLRHGRIKYSNSDGFSEIYAWFTHDDIMLSTVREAFTEVCDSIKTQKEAQEAESIIAHLLARSEGYDGYNPWKKEKASYPGYAIIPHVQAHSDWCPQTLPQKDQALYKTLLLNSKKNRFPISSQKIALKIKQR